MYCQKHDTVTYRQTFCIACVLEAENARLKAELARVNERIQATREAMQQKEPLDTEG